MEPDDRPAMLGKVAGVSRLCERYLPTNKDHPHRSAGAR